MNGSESWLAAPKAELHCHLELAVRPSTLREAALAMGMNVASDEAFEQAFLIRQPMGNLTEVLNKFLHTRDVLASEALMERVAFEICEDFHLQANVRVLELRYAPSFLLDAHDGMTADGLHAAIVRGVRRAEATYPMVVGLICILQRTKSASDNAHWTDFAISNRDTFVALDLADDETNEHPEPFIPLFQRAKAAGLGITIHAGEPAVAGIERNIRTAIEDMGADRIGHGVQAIRDEAIIQLLVDTGTPLELCPTSNWLTGAVPSLAAHPLARLHRAGVVTTINTDDPTVMCTNLHQEISLLLEAGDLTLAELEEVLQNGRRVSFLPATEIDRVWVR
jgi:adenosine deaminase